MVVKTWIVLWKHGHSILPALLESHVPNMGYACPGFFFFFLNYWTRPMPKKRGKKVIYNLESPFFIFSINFLFHFLFSEKLFFFFFLRVMWQTTSSFSIWFLSGQQLATSLSNSRVSLFFFTLALIYLGHGLKLFEEVKYFRSLSYIYIIDS